MAGLGLLFIYAAIYTGSVAICTFRYDRMGTIMAAGLNLAVGYGMGLIALGVVMAVVYMLMCKQGLVTIPLSFAVMIVVSLLTTPYSGRTPDVVRD